MELLVDLLGIVLTIIAFVLLVFLVCVIYLFVLYPLALWLVPKANEWTTFLGLTQ